MARETVTIRVTTQARRLLRLIAATNDEEIMALVDRLALAEWEQTAKAIAQDEGNWHGYEKYLAMMAAAGTPNDMGIGEVQADA